MIETKYQIGDLVITNRLIDGVLYSSLVINPHSKKDKVKYAIVEIQSVQNFLAHISKFYNTNVTRIVNNHVIVTDDNHCYIAVNHRKHGKMVLEIVF